jgi:hypothetical protein
MLINFYEINNLFLNKTIKNHKNNMYFSQNILIDNKISIRRNDRVAFEA